MDIEDGMNACNVAKPSEIAKAPRVSIGMPVYNGAKFIHEALDSLLSQTFTDFELIISDNASIDETEAICRGYAAKDSRIHYVRQVKNFGASANFQFVLDEAVGEYFMWAAADDSQDKELIEQLVSILLEDEKIVLATADVENIDEYGGKMYREFIDAIRVKDAKRNCKANRKLFFRNPTTNIFFSIYGLYRTDVAKATELNYKNMVKNAAGSEIPLLAQVSLQGLIVSIPKPLKIYRRHKKSLYHMEAKGMSSFEKLSNQINISYVLFIIIIRSAMRMFDKIILLNVVVFDFFRILLRTSAIIITKYVSN